MKDKKMAFETFSFPLSRYSDIIVRKKSSFPNDFTLAFSVTKEVLSLLSNRHLLLNASLKIRYRKNK